MPEKTDTDFADEEVLSSSISKGLIAQKSVKRISELQKELLETGQRSAASDTETRKWYEWFIRQTDLHQNSKIEETTYINMINRYQKFLQEKKKKKEINP